MKLSKRCRYGLRALTDLAVNADRGQIQLADIARRNQISFKYLEQIFISLRKAGIIKSVKGAQGGYLLGAKAEDISVAEVIRVLDGEYLLEEEDAQEQSPSVAIQKVLVDPYNRMTELFLKELTLQTLVDSCMEDQAGRADMYYI